MPLIINNEEWLVWYMLTKDNEKYSLDGEYDCESKLKDDALILKSYKWEDQQCILEWNNIRIVMEKLWYSYNKLLNVINNNIEALRREEELEKLEDVKVIKITEKKDKQVRENKAFYWESKWWRPKVSDIYYHEDYKLNSYSTWYLMNNWADHRTLKKWEKYIKFKNRYFKREDIIENFKKSLTED